MKELKVLNKYFLQYKRYLFLGLIFIIITSLFTIIPAQIVRHAFNLVSDNINIIQMLDGFDLQENVYNTFGIGILIYGGLILGIALFKGLFLFLVRQTIIVMSRHIEYDLKNDIYKHYQSLPQAFYKRNNTGDLMTRISEDVSRVRMYLGPSIMYGIQIVVLMIMVITIMFSVNAKLTLYTLIPLPFLSISIYYVNNIINKRSEEIQESLSLLSTFAQESFSGIRIIKAYNREFRSIVDFTNESNQYKNKSIKLTIVQSLFFPLIMGLIGASVILIIFIGGKEVMAGNITIGNIAEFIMYLNMLTWPIASLGWVTSITQRAAASQKRINEFMHEETDLKQSNNLSPEIKGNISFKHVSFTYPDTGIEALKDININIKAGETISIIGTTGSGKSSIAALMCHLYDSSQGELSIENNPIEAINTSHLRSHIGFVLQDIFLFSESIRNNIAFGTNNATEEMILQAAKDADLNSFLDDLELGLDTKIGERGITLSGGQKQRVSIARALIRNPQILILDDCLSAVDTKTENTILQNLKRIMQHKTSIIISHRVSSAQLADYIIVLDEGEVVEEGSHKELLLKNGTYKELYEKQLEGERIA